jgi:hypothetical protein
MDLRAEAQFTAGVTWKVSMKAGKLEPKIQLRIFQNFEDRTTIRRRKDARTWAFDPHPLTPHAGGDNPFTRHDR